MQNISSFAANPILSCRCHLRSASERRISSTVKAKIVFLNQSSFGSSIEITAIIVFKPTVNMEPVVQTINCKCRAILASVSADVNMIIFSTVPSYTRNFKQVVHGQWSSKIVSEVDESSCRNCKWLASRSTHSRWTSYGTSIAGSCPIQEHPGWLACRTDRRLCV